MTLLLARRFRIKPKRSKPRRGRLLDPAYRAFIKAQPCICCVVHRLRQASRTEAAHVGERGLGEKCDDNETLPLCALTHHREGPESAHVLGKRFWEYHNLDRYFLIDRYRELYALGGGD